MMKSFIIIAIAMLSSNAAKAANESSRVAQAIQSANTADLVNMFNSSIELLTPSSSGISTKEQAASRWRIANSTASTTTSCAANAAFAA